MDGRLYLWSGPCTAAPVPDRGFPFEDEELYWGSMIDAQEECDDRDARRGTTS